jgi:RNA polymerase sigma-70 factor (ECF subfamily)
MPVAGKQDEFERAVRAFSTDLQRFAYWLCRDRFTAEDLVQETFARAWKAWDSLRASESRSFWLIAILRNENARRLASAAPNAATEVEALELSAPRDAHSFFELEDLVHDLPLVYREPLLLQVLGGFSGAEIAAMLGITEGAVMTRLTRARQALRSTMRSTRERRMSG